MRPGWASKLVFALAALALLAVALLLAPGRRPDPGRAATLWLAVESLAGDGDLAYGEREATAFAGRFGERPRDVRLEKEGKADLLSLRAPAALWARALAPAHRLAGWRGVFAAQWCLVVGSAVLLAWALRPRLGGSGAPALVAVVVFASAAALAAIELVPEALLLLAAALAGALVWGRRSGPTVEPGEIYGGELEPRRALGRWPLAGLGFGVVACGAPAYLPLAAPLLAAAPAGGRVAARGLFALGAAASFAGVALAAGWPWPPLELWHDPALLGWGALGLVAGRAGGILTWFLPAALALSAPARDEGRRGLPWAVLAALVLQLVTSPFDYAGESGATGNPFFLPLLAFLLFAAGRAARPAALAAAALASAVLIAPAWLGALRLDGVPFASLAGEARALLPLDTTLRELPGAATLDHGAGIVVRGFPPAVLAGADGRLRLAGARATLYVESAAQLASLRFELGRDAPASVEVTGGQAGDVILRPSGEVAVEVRFGAPTREHPTWRSPTGAAIYRIGLELPRAPAAPLPLDISIARPRGAEREPE